MITLFLIILGACAVGLAYCSLMLVRNEIVFRSRMKAVDICYDIHASEELQAVYDLQNYDSQMYEFRCWTFAQFYPQLKDLA